MPASPVNSKTDLISFTILAAGNEIADTLEVLSIHTTKRINKQPYATLVLLDGSAATSDYEVSNQADFLPGTEMEIKAGYHSKNATLFKGIITKHSVKASDTASELTLEIRDTSLKMTSGRKNAYYKEKKDSDIISALISPSGASADVEATTYQHKNMIQFNATDWDFMLTRAEANGLLVYVSDGKVSVKKPDTSGEAALVISYGSTLLEFSAEMDAEELVKTAKGYAWDSANQKVVNGTGKSSVQGPGNVSADTLAGVMAVEEYTLQSNGNIEASELKSWAEGLDARSKLSSITGFVKFQGSSLAQIGEMIELEGIGKRFNGKAFISGVSHAIEDGQWTTEVNFGLDRRYHYETARNVSSPAASGLLPSVSGLQIGIVKQVHEDPDGSFRVLTKVPILQEDKDAVWARLGTYYASNGFGNFFYPEVNDEVILGFINDDPRYPVILGSVYSKQNKAPKTPEQKNELKALVTKSKIEVSFDDKDKILTLKTPGGNEIVISDKDKGISITDQNKNSATFDSSGVTIESASNMTLKPKGYITLDAQGNLAQTAKANVTVEGLQVSCTAKTAFAAKGNATAELSASGQTTVKGAMVMIN